MTSGNAYSKIAVAIVFGFIAGRMVDRFGPRRLMLGGIVMAGLALVGLSYATTMGAFYLFYAFNALGYVCGGPLPNQVLLSRWFDKGRGKAMGIAYLGIGVGGALVPLLAYKLTQALRLARRAVVARHADDRGRAAGGVVRARAAGRGGARARRAKRSLAPILSRPAFFLLLDRQHGIDRRRRRHDAEPGAVSEPRSQAGAGRRRCDAVADPDRQPRRPAVHGMAGRSRGEEARDDPDLRDRRRGDSAAVLRADAGDAEAVRVRVRHRPRRRLHDHPADGRGAVRRGDHGPRDGHRAHRRQRRRVGGADDRRRPARFDRQLRARLHGARRPRRRRRDRREPAARSARCGGGRAGAAADGTADRGAGQVV